VTPTPDPRGAGHPGFEAAAGDQGRRLDVVVADRLPEYTRSRVAVLAGRGAVLVEGRPRKAAVRLRAGQRVQILAPPADPLAVNAEPIPLDVCYEDGDLLVVNKPAGLTVHPAPGHPRGTLVNAVLAHVPGLSSGGALRPGIVHRLDKDTSGLLVVAKNDEAYRKLTAQLRARTVVRGYLVIVRGAVADTAGMIDAPIGRHPAQRTRMAVVPHGRPAVTRYRVRERLAGATLLECRLETGRTHQIRVHLQHLGHPVLGDPVYGRTRVPELNRQALHAARLEFVHPRTGEHLAFAAPLPDDFAALLVRLRRDVCLDDNTGIDLQDVR
jgi:23S rRNA pseudouridine1911/1915/1917 synthase